MNKYKTLFLLDWDDTLFPTTWILKNGINLMIPNNRDRYIDYFNELDVALSSFLKTVLNLGKVIIVTNALIDWIKISSIVLPKTYILLKNINVVSARGTYKNKSNNIMDWKLMAFHDIINKEFKDNSIMNIISVGDAEYEYQALISLQYKKKGYPKCLKSIKFIKYPTHDTLIEQLEVLNRVITEITLSKTHLDLVFNVY